MTVNKGLFSGGENGIRTHERITPLHAFQACAFNHSAISPKMINTLLTINILQYIINSYENL